MRHVGPAAVLHSIVTALSAAITDEEKRCMERLFSHLSEANRIMRYLQEVAVVAMRCGRGPAMWASLLSVAAFAFFFVPLYLTFAVPVMGSLAPVSTSFF